MTNEEAWIYAASWGSYMNSSDPGACMYGFSADFRVQSEQHRADCIAQMRDNRSYVETHPSDYEPNELEQIDALLAKLETAEVSA